MIEGFAQLHPACRQPMPNHHIEKDKYSYLVIWKNEEQRDIVKADDIVRALRAYCVKKKKKEQAFGRKQTSFEESRYNFIYTGWRKIYLLFLCCHFYFPEIILLVL